jgi:YgiT-type zinc finger domain-containing protein
MTELCPHCHLGLPRVERTTYARRVDLHLVVVPDIEALVCDHCGAVDFDFETLGRLEILLVAGASSAQRLRMGPPIHIPTGAWASGRPIRAV